MPSPATPIARWRGLAALVLAVVVGLATVGLAGCTRGGEVTSSSAGATGALRDPDVEGLLVSEARALLEADGWTVEVVGTKQRRVKRAAESSWQVVAVETGGDGEATLTAARRTTKTLRIDFATKRVRLSDEPTSYRKVVRQGRAGTRVITYLDGEKHSSEVTRKPVKRVVEIGTAPAYTGRCTILGSYAHRYVRCTGFYNPEAKRAAQELAGECNSTTSPLADCRGVYGRYFR